MPRLGPPGRHLFSDLLPGEVRLVGDLRGVGHGYNPVDPRRCCHTAGLPRRGEFGGSVVRDELTPDSDETPGLREEARAGDRRAFDRLLAGHRAELRQFVELRMDPRMRGRVDASDVVQETQLEVYRRLEDFLDRRPMPFHVWLRKTAHQP